MRSERSFVSSRRKLCLPSTYPTSDNPLGVISLSSLTTYSIFCIFDFTLRVLFSQRFFCLYFTIFSLFCTVLGGFSFAESGFHYNRLPRLCQAAENPLPPQQPFDTIPSAAAEQKQGCAERIKVSLSFCSSLIVNSYGVASIDSV